MMHTVAATPRTEMKSSARPENKVQSTGHQIFMSIVPFFSIAPILDDDSTSESSEDSAQAAARAEVQKQRKLKPGTLTLTNSTTVHNWFINWLYACMKYLSVTPKI